MFSHRARQTSVLLRFLNTCDTVLAGAREYSLARALRARFLAVAQESISAKKWKGFVVSPHLRAWGEGSRVCVTSKKLYALIAPWMRRFFTRAIVLFRARMSFGKTLQGVLCRAFFISYAVAVGLCIIFLTETALIKAFLLTTAIISLLYMCKGALSPQELFKSSKVLSLFLFREDNKDTQDNSKA
jgi:hypothetical protein